MIFREAAPRQRVYILRFWETRSLPPDAPVTWRFSAQDPQTGERRGFADLDGLMAFLAAQTGEPAGSRTGSPGVAASAAHTRPGETDSEATGRQGRACHPSSRESTATAAGQSLTRRPTEQNASSRRRCQVVRV